MKQILLVEDDKVLSNGICLALKSEQITMHQSYDLRYTRELLTQNRFDLILLDINLPDGNGLDLLKELYEKSDTPVIVLTANDMEIDIVTGLEMGAEDYITKPFSLAVLRARVNTQLRRSEYKGKGSCLIHIDGYSFDFEHMEFRRNDTIIELSKTEQRLLRVLVENKGIVLSRADLVDYIWTFGAEYVDENALSVTVKRLRDKLEENPAKPAYIKTVYGIGYTWSI